MKKLMIKIKNNCNNKKVLNNLKMKIIYKMKKKMALMNLRKRKNKILQSQQIHLSLLITKKKDGPKDSNKFKKNLSSSLKKKKLKNLKSLKMLKKIHRIAHRRMKNLLVGLKDSSNKMLMIKIKKKMCKNNYKKTKKISMILRKLRTLKMFKANRIYRKIKQSYKSHIVQPNKFKINQRMTMKKVEEK
jgi:hypothetical protein